MAISLAGSVAMTVNAAVRPSLKITEKLPDWGGLLLANAATWLLVMISPSALKTIPEAIRG